MGRILSLLLLFIPLSSAQTCFISAGVAADDSIVPCGTDLNAACCQLGDVCLWDSACWNPNTNVTYVYGCTDASYTASVCPWKCGPRYTDAPVVDLQYCNDVREGIWSCAHPNMAGQSCEGDSQVAFAAPSVINPILSLPSTVGGATEYFSEISPNSYTLVPGYTPTSLPVVVPWKPTAPVEVMSVNPTTTTTPPTPISTTTPTSSSRIQLSSTTTTTTSSSRIHLSSTTSSTPSATASTSTSFSTTASGPTASLSAVQSSSILSAGAKAGIGVAVGLGLLILLILGLAFFCIRRRRRGTREPVPHQEVQYFPSGVQKLQRPYSDAPVELASPAPTSMQMRGELPNDTPCRHSGNSFPLAEMDSDPRYGSTAPTYTT